MSIKIQNINLALNSDEQIVYIPEKIKGNFVCLCFFV